MNISEGIRIAAQTVKANKLRTFLTTLGIVIGVMSVIGMMSIINALELKMKQTLSAVGGGVFWVQKYPAVRMGRLDNKYRMRKDITFDQALQLQELATRYVDKISPEIGQWGKTIKYEDQATNPSIMLYGGDDTWAEVNGQIIQDGRHFNRSDIYHRRNVIILGNDVVEKLFPFTYPIGKTVRIGNKKFEVIATLEAKGQFLGGSQDNLVSIPYTTFLKSYGQHRSINVGVKAKSGDLVPEAMDEVRSYLRIIRKTPPAEEDDFELVTQDSIMGTLKSLTGFVFVAAVVICAISLLVGGIGIMNIMLMAVTERTREIGVRKAVGAKRKDIMNQFLIEALGICSFGGIIGILLGVLIGVLVSGALKLPPVIPFWSVILGFGFSLFIGLIFGVYPAMKAARLDPIEALRYE